ncbi:DUF6214 family protein [Streptomyces sp. PmtG]
MERQDWPGAQPLTETPPALLAPLTSSAYAGADEAAYGNPGTGAYGNPHRETYDSACEEAYAQTYDGVPHVTMGDYLFRDERDERDERDGRDRGDGRDTGDEDAADAEEHSPLFHLRLALDGARVDVLAAVSDEHVAIEDLRADPPLPLHELVALACRIEGPLADVCRGVAQQYGPPVGPWGHADEMAAARRARPSVQRPSLVRQAAVEAYRVAQDEGRDPVLAVMGATGHSRRKSLRLIAGARDAGHLAPRHRRR